MAKRKATRPETSYTKEPRQVRAPAGPSSKAVGCETGATLEEGLGTREAATGRFLPGHCFWKARTSSGPKPLFEDGDALWTACCEYFCWVADNPLYERRLVTFRGTAWYEPVAKMRAMTKRGLCLFLGIDHRTWNVWKKERLDLMPAIEQVESVIWIWKFDGAAAGLLNANIVAHELSKA